MTSALLRATAALAFSAALAAGAAAGAGRFPVIGYFPVWTGTQPDQVPLEKLTHVNYAFVKPGEDGKLVGVNDALLKSLVRAAHAKKIKVCASVGGWKGGKGADWKLMVAHPATRREFIASLVKLCDGYALDGIDIDWENPDSASAEHLTLMMQELGGALRKRGRLLSTTVDALGDKGGAFLPSAIFASVDFLNIRAYDANWASRNKPHSTFGLADSALDYWRKRGCPREKAVLGVPFYGRSYNSEQQNTYAKYRDIIQLDEDAPGKDEAGGYFYNGVPTIRKKAELALKKAGGIMIWEVTQDTTGTASLLGTIDAVVRQPAAR